jgi:SpoU rRNA methylase family enzyme
MVKAVYLVAYAPSSPQRLQDLAKLAYSINIVSVFIAIKPVGMAAQVGVPEVFRLAYKLDKRFAVFPRLQDLKDVMNIEQLFFIIHHNDVPDLCDVGVDKSSSIAIIVQAGETSFTKEDLLMGIPVKLKEIDDHRFPNPVADAAIALMKLKNMVVNNKC